MNEWSFYELEEIPKAEHLIVGMPDVGLVGLIASTYLVREMKASIVAYLDSRHLPPVIQYHEAKPYPVMRIYRHAEDGKRHLLLVSEVPFNPAGYQSFAGELVEWIRLKGVHRTVLLGGIPTPQRMNLEKPSVYCAGVTEDDLKEIEGRGLKLFKEGYVSGPYAQILKECFKYSINCVALFAESFLNYPDPGAAAAVILALSSLIGIRVNVEPLLEQEEEIRAKLRETMKRTMEAMQETGKAYEYTIPAMYL